MQPKRRPHQVAQKSEPGQHYLDQAACMRDKLHRNHTLNMNHSRRHFIKHASLGFGASVLGAPYLVRAGTFHAKSTHQIQGAVRSGSSGSAIPLVGAQVSLYEATSGAPRLRGTATTDALGNFVISIAPPGSSSGGIFYATADLESGLQLVSVIGPSLLPFVRSED